MVKIYFELDQDYIFTHKNALTNALKIIWVGLIFIIDTENLFKQSILICIYYLCKEIKYLDRLTY